MEVALGKLLHTWETNDKNCSQTMATFTIDNPQWKVLERLTDAGWERSVDAMERGSIFGPISKYNPGHQKPSGLSLSTLRRRAARWFSCPIRLLYGPGQTCGCSGHYFSVVLPTGEGVSRSTRRRRPLAAIDEVNTNTVSSLPQPVPSRPNTSTRTRCSVA